MSANQNSENDPMVNSGQSDQNGGPPIVFMREATLFGDRRPEKSEWLKHTELYGAIANIIDPTHITGLQRVNGMWRIYMDNLNDKVALLNEGVVLRGKRVPLLKTNPNRLDSEQTIRIRIKNIPLSADDGIITRPLILKGIEIITSMREKLRYNGKLTNCETGDRLFTVKATTLKSPLPRFMTFGKFVGRVIHLGQTNETKTDKCKKCLENGHIARDCPNDWKCTACFQSGHKKGDCEVTAGQLPAETPPPPQTTSRDEQSAVPGNPRQPAEKPDHTDGKAESKKSKKKKKHADSNQGQPLIDKFCGNSDTPNKGRPRKVQQRSPPTPAETLNDNIKKLRAAAESEAGSAPESSDASSGED